MNENKDQHSDYKPSETLERDLKSLFSADFPVPDHVDRTVMSRANQHLVRPRRNHRQSYWGAYAAAAAVAIAALFLNIPDNPSQPQPPLTPISQKDIDNNGTVNILDAFKLARSIKSQQVPNTQWDINNDGLVDQQDVDAVAMAAVRLNEGVL